MLQMSNCKVILLNIKALFEASVQHLQAKYLEGVRINNVLMCVT